MRRHKAIAIIQEHWDELKEMGVLSISLVGELARDKAGPNYKLEILVDVRRPMGFAFFGVQDFLEKLLGQPVLLVTPGSYKPEDLEKVLREAVRAA